jgi:hypothetical protein
VHLQEQIDEYIALGMAPDEARLAALRAFGPIARIEEGCRDTRRVAAIEHVAQDLRYTLRSLMRQPMLITAAVLSVRWPSARTRRSSWQAVDVAMPSAARPGSW